MYRWKGMGIDMVKNNEHEQQKDVEKEALVTDLIEQFDVDEDFVDVLTEGMKDYAETLKDLSDR